MKTKAIATAVASVLGAGSMMFANAASAHIAYGDPVSDGIGYHLTYFVHHTGALSTETGATRPGIDGAPSGVVGTLGSRSWSDIVPTTGSPCVNASTLCGWTHNSKWALVDLGDLADGQYRVTMTLERSGTGAVGDLIPALTAWLGAEQDGAGAGGAGTEAHWYPNMYTNTYGATWWAEDLTPIPNGYDTAADNANTGLASLTFLFNKTATDKFLTAVLGGNDDVLAKHAANFKFTVDVQAVPIPAAVWLFGSALAGMGIIGRRKSAQSALAA